MKTTIIGDGLNQQKDKNKLKKKFNKKSLNSLLLMMKNQINKKIFREAMKKNNRKMILIIYQQIKLNQLQMRVKNRLSLIRMNRTGENLKKKKRAKGFLSKKTTSKKNHLSGRVLLEKTSHHTHLLIRNKNPPVKK